MFSAASRDVKTAMAAALLSLLVWAVFQSSAYWQAGMFEYPLDDVYIHLAMAEEIARGGYGVNAGELASAASSPLYPYLLTPFTGSEFQVYLPLLWNVAAMFASAWLWALIVIRAFASSPDDVHREAIPLLSMVLALFGPVALNFPGLAFTGMEHSLHLLTTLAVVRGLQLFLLDGKTGWVLLAGIILGPLMRFEALSVSFAAVLVIGMAGNTTDTRSWGKAAGLSVLTLLPVGLFCGYLVSLGLDPLPNSVQAKLAGSATHHGLSFDILAPVVMKKIATLPAKLLLGAVVVAIAMLLTTAGRNGPKLRPLLLAVVFAGGGHLVLGQFGWMNRYEIYIMSFVAGIGILAVAQGSGSGRQVGMAGTILALITTGVYYHLSAPGFIQTARAISLQQRQMARFATEFHKAPVAVNDLGHVAWQNPWYVLDLWGLASSRALKIRQNSPPAGWADALVVENDVRLAMIYKDWLQHGIGRDWVELGELQVLGNSGAISNPRVNFFATAPEYVSDLTAQLTEFSKTLPEGARFVATVTMGAGESD